MKIAGNNSSSVYQHSFAHPATATGVIKAIGNIPTDVFGGGQDILIHSITFIPTAVASGATCTVDAGVGDSATDTADSRSDDILDGIDLGSGQSALIGTSINNIALDIAGATGSAAPLLVPVDDYLLIHVKTGDATGVAGGWHVVWSFAGTS